MRAEYNRGRGREESKPVQLPKQVSIKIINVPGIRPTHIKGQSPIGNCLQCNDQTNADMQVTPEMLKLLLEYCQFHRAAGRSDKVGADIYGPADVNFKN